MNYPGSLQELEDEFGTDCSSLGRSIRTTLDWLHNNHSYRITNNLGFWNYYQEIFSNAIGNIPSHYRLVTSFLDGTYNATFRPSDGRGRPFNAQRLYYSGYYLGHGFKFQSLMYPNGKIVHILLYN
jgi:hypothetical protein